MRLDEKISRFQAAWLADFHSSCYGGPLLNVNGVITPIDGLINGWGCNSYKWSYGPLLIAGSCRPCDTVDGGNPAPVDRWFIPLFTRVYIHPRWCRISSINSMVDFNGDKM